MNECHLIGGFQQLFEVHGAGSQSGERSPIDRVKMNTHSSKKVLHCGIFPIYEYPWGIIKEWGLSDIRVHRMLASEKIPLKNDTFKNIIRRRI